ncbi:discoidin domain-containing protein [bacterium]|nr:MAG: discoidin domain-containing protein [bacterium]
MRYSRLGQKGAVLVLTFIIMASLTAIAVSFLYMNSIQTKAMGQDISGAKALWLAEAGLQKAIWNLKTPISVGGQGEDWTTPGVTEGLGGGSYVMAVARWDFALSANGSSAAATSEQGSNVAANAIDGSDDTYWESQNKPSSGNPQEIIIAFPYSLIINKARFLVSSGLSQQRPKDYSWQVSADGVSYSVVLDVNNNNSLDVVDTFAAASNVKYLKLQVTKTGGGPDGVAVAALEAIGAKITSTGSAYDISRKIEQTTVADDATQTAYNEKDWNEIVPAS